MSNNFEVLQAMVAVQRVTLEMLEHVETNLERIIKATDTSKMSEGPAIMQLRNSLECAFSAKVLYLAESRHAIKIQSEKVDMSEIKAAAKSLEEHTPASKELLQQAIDAFLAAKNGND